MKPNFSRLHSGPAQRELHVGRPHIGNLKVFHELLDGVFERRWFTNAGSLVRELEERLKSHLNVKHCIPVCNATVGIQLACRALGLFGEVIVPAFTFVASAHAISWLGLQPIFCDVDRESHSLCPERVRDLITDRTSAIMGVHLWGQPCMIESLERLAKEHELKLLFDAAHAFHCDYQGTPIGNFGNCEVFSFHATKFFNTFEGGAIATNDDGLASKIRKMKNFGFEGPEQVNCLGTNAKMSEVNAAMGLSMFECIDEIAAKNLANYHVYHSMLGAEHGLRVFPIDESVRRNGQYLVVEIDEERFGCSRDDIYRALNQKKIFAKRYFSPGCHKLSFYESDFMASGRNLCNTDLLCDRVLCLPTGTDVNEGDIRRVCEIVLRSQALHRDSKRNLLGRKVAS